METAFHFDSFVIMCDYDPMFSVVGFNFFSPATDEDFLERNANHFVEYTWILCFLFLHFDFHCYLLGFPFFDLFLEWSLICKINNG